MWFYRYLERVSGDIKTKIGGFIIKSGGNLTLLGGNIVLNGKINGVYLQSGAGEPVTANTTIPSAKGAVYIDTTNADIYIATTTAASGWKKITRAT